MIPVRPSMCGKNFAKPIKYTIFGVSKGLECAAAFNRAAAYDHTTVKPNTCAGESGRIKMSI